METVTKEELEEALFDLTDGDRLHDLRGKTGLPEERCEEIWRVICLVRKSREK